MIKLPAPVLEGLILRIGKQADARIEALADLEAPLYLGDIDLIEYLLRVAETERLDKSTKVNTLRPHAAVGTVLGKALERAPNRLLPGAKMIRSGRPITDIMKKFKKIQRRALKGSMIGFRKAVKSNQKALINAARSSARSAYL